jgi:hypothetical protein
MPRAGSTTRFREVPSRRCAAGLLTRRRPRPGSGRWASAVAPVVACACARTQRPAATRPPVACEGSSSAFRPRRTDTAELRSGEPATSIDLGGGPEIGPNTAKSRSFQPLPSLSDSPPLSSCTARQLPMQALESTALSAAQAIRDAAAAALRASAPAAQPARGRRALPKEFERTGRGGATGATWRCDVACELPQF